MYERVGVGKETSLARWVAKNVGRYAVYMEMAVESWSVRVEMTASGFLDGGMLVLFWSGILGI